MAEKIKRDGGTPSSSVSRRTFLKTLGGGAAAAAIPGAALAAPIRQARGDEAKVLGPGKAKFVLEVNGQKKEVEAEPRLTLLDVLRNHLDLTGAKNICDMGECGGCTVLIDDVPRYSCLTLALDARGRKITTVEGLETDRLNPTQMAFVKHDAFQCGFCTPGWIMSVEALRRKGGQPDDEKIREALTGNLCRCSAYPKILEAARAVAGKGGGDAKKHH